jgi:hypothetical protein
MTMTPEDIAAIDRREGSRHGWLAARDAARMALGYACPAAFFDGWHEVQRDPDTAEIIAALFELRAELNR